MVKHTKLLDCTLRDGAYLLDKRFGDDIITVSYTHLTLPTN